MKIGVSSQTNPDARCPVCGHKHSGATNIDPIKEGTPKAGDCSVCIECATLLVFNKDLTLHEMTDEERISLLSENPEGYTALVNMSQFIKRGVFGLR